MIPFGSLLSFTTQLLVARGYAAPDAEYIAKIAVESEASGNLTHGLSLLRHSYHNVPDAIDPSATPTISKAKNATALIQAEKVAGALTMRFALEQATMKAKEHGVGFVSATRTNWIGPISAYLRPIASAGYISFVWVQSSSCQDAAPTGGIDPHFSTNPIGYAFPLNGKVVTADFATTELSMGATARLKRAGRQSEHAIFLDEQGKPTTDPTVVQNGGSMHFMGGATSGHKGYALSLWNEALTAQAGGHANNPDVPGRQSFTVLVSDIDAFAGLAYFNQELGRLAEVLHSSRPIDPAKPVRLPGERSGKNLQQARENGVELEPDKLQLLRQLAEDAKMDWPFTD